jgi:hypothetical protein
VTDRTAQIIVNEAARGPRGAASTVPGPAGDTGPAGASAYDVAVANGFIGSPADWLLSLRGPQGSPGIGGGSVRFRTPYDFGAVAGAADNSDALQDFFDEAFDPVNANQYVYDWSGDWNVSRTIYAAYDPNDHTARLFICGRLIFPRRSLMPEGAVIPWGMFIAGYKSNWLGPLAVFGVGLDAALYDDCPFKIGVALCSCNTSQFDKISVTNSRKQGTQAVPHFPLTIRAGTPYELTLSSNNIGLGVGHIEGICCGSTSRSPSTSYSTTLTAFDQGHYEAGVFSGVSAGYGNSALQATQITVPSTAEFEVRDRIKLKHSLVAANFGTLAYDNATRKITRTAGSWITDGLQVGDRYSPTAGVNAALGNEFIVLSVAATEITVSPAPATEAASAIGAFESRWLYFPVIEVTDATRLVVTGWVPSRIPVGAVVWLSSGFAFDIFGSNTANIHVGYIQGFLCGGALRSAGLYGPSVLDLLGEAGDISIQVGDFLGQSVIGTNVEHFHSEGADFDILHVSASPGSHLNVKSASSGYWSRVGVASFRASEAQLEQFQASLRSTTIDFGGELLVNNNLYGLGGDNGFTQGLFGNNPQHRERNLLADGGTVYLTYDYDADRLGGECNWCRLRWMGSTGAAPTGTLQWAIDAELTAQGWTLVGGGNVTAPGTTCRFEITFIHSSKKIVIQRFNAS